MARQRWGMKQESYGLYLHIRELNVAIARLGRRWIGPAPQRPPIAGWLLRAMSVSRYPELYESSRFYPGADGMPGGTFIPPTLTF